MSLENVNNWPFRAHVIKLWEAISRTNGEDSAFPIYPRLRTDAGTGLDFELSP